MKGRSGCLLLVSFLMICLFPGVTLGETVGTLVPLDFGSIGNDNEFFIVRFNFPSFSVDLEVLLREEPYLPLRSLAPYYGYEVILDTEIWHIKFNNKTNRVFLEGGIIEIQGLGVTVKGDWSSLRQEYYLSLSDFQLLTALSAIWNPSLMEINVPSLPITRKNDRTGKETEVIQDNYNSFQPINRLSYSSNTFYSFYTPPISEEFTTDLTWETGGTIWDGQLTLGGLVDYNFNSGDSAFDLKQVLWERETELGKWSIGTLSLPYGAFYPYTWQVNGLAYSTPEWRPLYLAEKPVIRGRAPIGSTVELWVDDLLYQTKPVEDNGDYEFELWLVSRRSHRMRLIIKDGRTLLKEKKWLFLPRDNYLAPNTTHFLTSIGVQEENNYNIYKNLFTSVSEWLIGFERATLGLNLAAIEETDTSDKILQFSEVSNWQAFSNLTLDTRVWYVAPDLGRAGRLSLNFGLPKTTFLTSYYYQPKTFSPVFAEVEEGKLKQFDLATYWEPRQNYLLQIRSSYKGRQYQDTTEESNYSHEAGLSALIFSGVAMGILGQTNQTSKDNMETVNKNAELSWSSGAFSNYMYEIGWTREKVTTEDSLNEEQHEKYWLDMGFGLYSDRRYSLYLFSESTLYNDIKDEENGLNLTFWQKNPDASYWSLGVGFSERTKKSYSWPKWSLKTSYYKEIIPETFLIIAGNYSYEPNSPVGDSESYQISIEIDGGFSFTPQGILPGNNTGSINDGQISGQVFLDSNSNGVLDEGEKGISGIEVAVDKIANSITDSQGRFIFHRVPPGIRHVKINIFTLPLKYRPVTDEVMITVTAGSTQSVNLGLEIVGSVSGRVYIDTNKNGEYDPKVDQPLRGVRIVSSDQKHSTVTGQNGDYYILLTPGTYRLAPDEASLPDGLTPIENIVTITTSAEEITGLDFPLPN